MNEIIDKNNCCGCSACLNICPVNAIVMIEDEKGFKYPVVNKEKCIACGKCKSVCPILNEIKIEIEPEAYACKNKDDKIRIKSSSGGVFSLISKEILNKNGVVFGAAWDENFLEVNHIDITKEEDLEKLRGAKYLQSNINETYRKVKKYLEDDRFVLFSGTPCQIVGLKKYLNKEYEKLILQDIICHGVPSPLVWRKYKYFSESNNKVNNVEFRNKEVEGWNKYHVKMDFDDNTTYNVKHDDDIFMKLFLSNIVLRDSCTTCRFKTKDRISDITLADFWGINNVLPEMNDEKGTSLVIVNSDKGRRLFDEIASNMEYEKVNLNDAIKYNPSYNQISSKNKNAEAFFENFENVELDELVNKYIPKMSLCKKIINKIKRILKKTLKRILRKL